MDDPVKVLMGIIHTDKTGKSRELLMPLVNSLRGISLHIYDKTKPAFMRIDGEDVPCSEAELAAYNAGYAECLKGEKMAVSSSGKKFIGCPKCQLVERKENGNIQVIITN